MRKFALMVVFLCLLILSLSACGGKAATDPASTAVENYINALVNKDSAKLTALSCASWESDAMLELDSLQAVTTRLEGLTCKTSSTDGTTSQVNCQGKIVTTYNGEDQSLDLAARTYQVEKQGGDYLVCGNQ
jgi:hypothetical protein